MQRTTIKTVMEQEHRITYKAGITRRPSDFLCQDGELAECINLTTDSEELKPVVQPAVYINSAMNEPGMMELDMPNFLYIHKFNKEERYVGWVTTSDGILLVWGSVVNKVFYLKGYFKKDDNKFLRYTSGTKITSIGKILIISSPGGLQYYQWYPDEYDLFSMPLPEINFFAKLSTSDRRIVKNSSKMGEIFKETNGRFVIEDGKQDDFNDLVVGLYAKNKKTIADHKHFCEPFFVRAALEMFDGSYVYITNPIPLYPSVRKNTCVYLYEGSLYMLTKFFDLQIRQDQDFSKYRDIIKDVVIFASKGISIYNTGTDQPMNVIGQTSGMEGGVEYCDFVSTNPSRLGSTYTYHVGYATGEIQGQDNYVYGVLDQREDADILADIESTSLFYKLCSIGLNPTDGWIEIAEKMPDNVLPNLVNQPRLEYDDYYSRNRINADILYPYNSRLNLAGVKRGLFEGFENFIPYDNGNEGENEYFFYVKIKLDDGSEKWVLHVGNSSNLQGLYFFYPDPRATHVTIYNNKTHHFVCDADLKEHPMLNGSYYMRELPSSTTVELNLNVSEDGFHPWPWPAEDPTHEADAVNNEYMEELPNYIVQSEVNNPWVFKAGGYFKVGTGRILDVSTITQALSQGQFGNFPLLVFSESGIWAMSVGPEGYYSSIYPMSREVCINPNNIIQTDGAVFFVSKKGLMVVVGNDVRCVSGQINGEPFDYSGKLSPLAQGTEWQDIVVSCAYTDGFLSYISHDATQMAYDYTDSRIIIFNQMYSHAYIYNIADGTISKTILPMLVGHAISAVNNYPDYLIQGTVLETVEVEGEEVEVEKVKVFSFYEKPREEEVSERQLCFLLTRPMKLAGPVSQASLRQLKNVGTWLRKDAHGNELSCVKSEVYLSEDMQKWYPDTSRFGAAARYYRLALFIKMLPSERLSGTIITTQERRGNNMR